MLRGRDICDFSVGQQPAVKDEGDTEVFDPAAIGTTIIWLNADKEREADIERRGLAVPVDEKRQRRNLSRSLARQLRSAADRLDPGVNAGTTAA